MKRVTLLAYAICIVLLNNVNTLSAQTVEVDFYHDKLEFKTPDVSVNAEMESNPIQYLNQLSSAGVLEELFKEFEKQAKEYKLNEYFTFLLIKKTIERQFPKENPNLPILIAYQYFKERDYRIALTKKNKAGLYTIYAASKEQLIGIVNINNKVPYHGLLTVHDPNKPFKEKLYFTEFTSGQKLFTFRIEEKPKFKNSKVHTIEIDTKDAEGSILSVEISKSIIDFYKDAVQVTHRLYFEKEMFSSQASKILIDYLSERIKDLSPDEKVRFLLSFSRRITPNHGSLSIDDALYVDEVLFYETTDCEDNAVLFSWLLKNLSQSTHIGLADKKHVTVAVELENEPETKNYFSYKGKKYFVCEPSNPNDNMDLGSFPEDIREFEVVYSYSHK